MWLVLGPAAVLLGSTALFALDAVARHWRLTDRARLALALAGALGVANVVGGWGHPEDCVALALVVWAALALERGGAGAGHAPRSSSASASPSSRSPSSASRRCWPASAGAPRRTLSWRLVVPSVVVLIPALVAETHRTLFVLLRQPVETQYNSLTPLTRFAPVIAPGLHGGGPTRLLATVLGPSSPCASAIATTTSTACSPWPPSRSSCASCSRRS